MREVRNDRQYAGVRKAERFEFLAVVLRVAECQIAAVGVETELATTEITELDEQRVHVDEVFRWSDVVIDQHHPIWQRVGNARCARTDRKMVNQDVVGMTGGRQLPV